MKINATKLRTLLFTKGITQKQLAERTGFTRNCICMICNGKSCKESTAQAIADALEVDLNTIKAKS